MPAREPIDPPETGNQVADRPQEEGDPENSERQAWVSDHFRRAGEDFGKDVALRLERNTRKVVREIMGSLQQEIQALKKRGFAVPQGTDPDAALDDALANPGSGGRTARKANWDTVREMLGKIQRQFENASREWSELQRTVVEVQQEIAGDSFGDDLGDLLPESAAPATGEESGASGETGSTVAPTSGAVKDGADPGEKRDAEGEVKLGQKLDDLISLVREHLADRERPGFDQEEMSAEWTYRIASEVARRLKDSFPVAAVSPTGALPPEAGEDSAGLLARSRKISIDDVAAMIDEITGKGA